MRILRQNPLIYPAGFRPGFDPSHPVAPGTIMSAVCSGGSFVNVLNGSTGPVTGTPAAGVDGLLGPNLNFTGSTDTVSLPGFTATPKSFTAATIWAPGGTDVTAFSTGGSPNWGMRLELISSSLALTFPAVGNIFDNTSGFTTTVGKQYFFAVSWQDAIGATFVWAPLNGTAPPRFSFISSGFSNTFSPGGTVFVGNGDSGSGRPAGKVSAIMYRGGITPTSTLLQLAADPWAFWYPRRTWNIVGAASVAAAKAKMLAMLGVG